MIAIDTNILVRYVTNDDPTQTELAVSLLGQKDKIFIAKSVLLELEWVLRAAYGLTRPTILKAIQQILGLPNIVIEDMLQVVAALNYYQSKLDFADALHLASNQEAKTFYTFDKQFAKNATNLSGVSVSHVKKKK